MTSNSPLSMFPRALHFSNIFRAANLISPYRGGSGAMSPVMAAPTESPVSNTHTHIAYEYGACMLSYEWVLSMAQLPMIDDM